MSKLTLVKPTIAELRQMIGASENQLQERSQFSLYPEGFSLGSVVEITGRGKTEWLASFLREQPTYKVAWVEKEISINPYALFQKQVDLRNILFIEAKNQIMWCLTQALGSGCFKVMITGDDHLSENEMRRIQLLSEKHQAHFFILGEQSSKTWVPSLKLKILKSKNQLNVSVIKKRGNR